MSDAVIRIELTEERYGRYDPAHGTPDPMVRRLLTLHTPRGEARFEQTDYGHSGRFNPWDPRGVDTRLQPHTALLRDLCDRVGSLLD
jgi:hypothetical protein